MQNKSYKAIESLSLLASLNKRTADRHSAVHLEVKIKSDSHRVNMHKPKIGAVIFHITLILILGSLPKRRRSDMLSEGY